MHLRVRTWMDNVGTQLVTPVVSSMFGLLAEGIILYEMVV